MIDLGIKNNSKVVFAIDTSGGISEEMFEKAKRVIEENLKSVSGVTATIVNFDTIIRNRTVVDGDISRSIAGHKLLGRGGTMPNDVFFEYKDEHIVMFSDMFFFDYFDVIENSSRLTMALFPANFYSKDEKPVYFDVSVLKDATFKKVVEF